MNVRAYLAMGSNMGERELNLKQAVEALQQTPGIVVKALSAIYETEPVGLVEQDAFLNMALAIETELAPQALLETVLGIERQMGRVRLIRWGPRLIDIDILLYGSEQVTLPDLAIPHPAMTERAFVLVPLRDVWEGGPLPVFHQTIDAFLDKAADYKGVRRWGTLDWEIGSGPFAS